MKEVVNKNVSLLKLIEDALSKLNWSPAELSRQSGVKPGNLSRYFKKGFGRNADNLYSILKALNLIKSAPERKDDITCGWDAKTIEACNAIKKIHDADNSLINAALESILTAFSQHVKQDREINKLKDDVSYLKAIYDPKQRPGTGKKAASGIGQKRKTA